MVERLVMKDLFRRRIQESVNVKLALLEDEAFLHSVYVMAKETAACIRRGGKLILCGNGGSASDALHFAGEIVGRFQQERSAWPAIVLNADVATVTSISNDYGFQEVYARQVQAFAQARDLLIGISTSGNSANILRAVTAAKDKGVKTAALLGGDGGAIGQAVDYPVIVPSSVTARVQESHICLIHSICEYVETELAGEAAHEAE